MLSAEPNLFLKDLFSLNFTLSVILDRFNILYRGSRSYCSVGLIAIFLRFSISDPDDNDIKR